MKRALARALVKASSGFHYRGFVAKTEDMKAAQAQAWKVVYQKIKSSAYWGEATPSQLEAYPISEFNDYEAVLLENRNHKISSLNGEEVLFWIKSGGTTGQEKLFPMTKSFKDQYQQTIGPFAHSLYQRLPNLGKKPILYFVGTRDLCQPLPSGVKAGYMSTYNYDNMPGLIKSLYQFPSKILDTQEEFSANSALYALSSDLSAMFAVTPLAYIRLINKINSNWTNLLSELQKGAVPVSKERLRYLEALRKPLLTFKDLWPSLEGLVSWQSSLCALQMESIKEFTHGLKLIDAVYSASEGWVNCPIGDELGGPLHPSAGVFEFIEVGNEIKVENILKPWELIPGKKYEILMTNTMGLVRYRIKDIVECTGYFNGSPKISFHSKADRTISLGIVTVAESELAFALNKSGVKDFQDWRVGPSPEGDQLVLYIDRELPEVHQLSLELEDALNEVSTNYRTFRKTNAVRALRIEFLNLKYRHWTKKQEHAQTKMSLLIDYDPKNVSVASQ